MYVFYMVCFLYGTHDVVESEVAAPQTAPPILRLLIASKSGHLISRRTHFVPSYSISFDLTFALEDITHFVWFCIWGPTFSWGLDMSTKSYPGSIPSHWPGDSRRWWESDDDTINGRSWAYWRWSREGCRLGSQKVWRRAANQGTIFGQIWNDNKY